MNLQPLYEVKARLEYAAVAGVSLLGEDFRLKRAAEGLKPLAAASPVFAKIDAGLDKLLSAPPEQRAGLLLDTLALVDAVAYTQAKSGSEGELFPLPARSGRYYQISYGQLLPLLTALTTTGGGRVEAVKSAWDRCPDYFRDYRLLPALVGGLGDSYGEMAELCARLLKKLGPSVVPHLKQDFDPAGKKDMARRVELIAALEGAKATPWLREIFPEARKEVRTAVIAALGVDSGELGLLLDLAKTERGKNRDAALTALAQQDGETVAAFWEAELAKKPESVEFLKYSRANWASDLVAAVLRAQIEAMLAKGDKVVPEDRQRLEGARRACFGKTSPAMLDCWRWMDSVLNSWEKMKNAPGQLVNLSGEIAWWLLDSLCLAGPGPLCELCRELWEKDPNWSRYLPHALVAALLTRSAAEVYDEFSPYILIDKPLLAVEGKQTRFHALFKGLGRVAWSGDAGKHLIVNTWPTAQPLDPRWFERLTRSVWKTTGRRGRGFMEAYWEDVEEYDLTLMRLADPTDEAARRLLIPYLRQRMDETGQIYTYSRWLFQLGGSPRGVIGEAMKRTPSANRLAVLWELLNQAAQALPVEEVAALMEEMLASKGIHKDAQAQAERSFPAAIALLKAGRPFPTWNDWIKL